MIVVAGATGNVGRPLVAALSAAGEQVTAVSRGTADPATPPGVRHRAADLAEPETLRPVLDGADALYLLVSGAGAHLDPYKILDVAKAGGVRRVVLQSSQAAGTRPASVSHAPLLRIEDALRQSGLDWTILRPGGFDSNAFAWADGIRDRRTVAAPFGDVGLPTIDPVDIAEVAAVVLRDRGHTGRTYELTGPAPVSSRERARAIGDALGTPVRFVEQSRDEARAQMLRFMPEPVVDGTLAILGEPTPAEQQVSPAVEQVLARKPRTFADWAARNIDAFR
ncbi:NAD(P)H-binding protein [Micromonospora sp. NBC_01796]|uniref:NAD(P)H-binding protein n=1 Tax=Micromonospora sp. NBC_01796 TaxID=2975987 RepID=UPI002DDA0DFD|nr:NAD(P)H-binding protein [Micromonospora sp. NBC_01796]WSA85447.1 NAD(P)H-binding protein [Micromonospora sp. NBC_01796]